MISSLFVAAACSAYAVDVWDSMPHGNLFKSSYYNSDGMLIGHAGDDKIYEAVVTGNKLPGTALAIRLISFNAVRLNKSKAKLDWKLDPFQQADTYLILKSSDGIHFQEMATVSSNNIAVYTFYDEALLPGTNYYKLAMIENRIDTTESKVVAVTNDQNGLEFTGWKRLAGDDYVFSMHSSKSILLKWQVIDITGRVAYSGCSQFNPGINSVTFNMAAAGSGTYYFRYGDPGRADPVVQVFCR